mgnify:CR=1 FL=1
MSTRSLTSSTKESNAVNIPVETGTTTPTSKSTRDDSAKGTITIPLTGIKAIKNK